MTNISVNILFIITKKFLNNNNDYSHDKIYESFFKNVIFSVKQYFMF